jgi:UDP-N-acetylglucosamine/UDP-N-acetylgalactosamine diphosphorylase
MIDTTRKEAHPTVLERFVELRQRWTACGQGHVFAFWDTLTSPQRAALLADLEQVDLERCLPLIETLVKRPPGLAVPGRIEPPEVLPAEPDAARRALYAQARQTGEQAVRDGRVAAFTVAGGQGTRLGLDGPKGALPISPVREACLFQLFAEMLLGTERRYGRRPRWYIMTSPSNHAQTLEVFERHRWFGLRPADVMLFPQRQMPAFLPDGRIAMAERHRLALSPDGHGGSLWALSASGALEDMRSRGIEYISYFQVDNPLVRAIDPLLIGLHIAGGSEMSSKAVTKAHDTERVGNFCRVDGRLCVIEYSDLPTELARARNPDGSRRFDAGSIAVHVLSRNFVERLTDSRSGVELPWHRAEKKVNVVDEQGRPVRPAQPNAVKLELFIFDAIPLAANPIVLYTPREEEFSPVKNAEGADSPATARRDLIRRAARWLESCGAAVPRDAQGEPEATIEISPAFALDVEDLRQRLREPPRIERGGRLLLD